MSSWCLSDGRQRNGHGHRRASSTRNRFWRRWFLANSLVAGVFALGWLILRSGAKPSRFAYPCQQAAFSAASLAFGAPLVATLLAARRQVVAGLRTRAGMVLAAIGLFAITGIGGYLSYANSYREPVLEPPRGYRARVFRVTDCPQDPVIDRFVGLDNLLALMGNGGLKFYQSDTETLISGPDGIIAADDTVLIKINYQWAERGGTNTDLLRGLIRRIVDHPDGFVGEIVIGENTQSEPTDSFDRDFNNAQDHSLSPADVVQWFQDQGHAVCRKAWRRIMYTQVEEYADGDLDDGYVVYPYDDQLEGRLSYPKFQTAYGTYISVRDGVWDPDSGTYDRARLKYINVPVLKSHSASYGATACVKHYMGLVTRFLGTYSHEAIRTGILGAIQGEIQMADLNILDCIWINANPNDGPWCAYDDATRRDQLLASVDPVATDIWAVKNILIPAFIEEGFSPPWPEPSADPDDPESEFREYLDNSMNWLLAAGYSVTNDLEQIGTTTWNGIGDLDNDCDVDLSDLAQLLGSYGATADATYYDGDLDQDGDVDLSDLAALLGVYRSSCP